jgi:hypothetical protein
LRTSSHRRIDRRPDRSCAASAPHTASKRRWAWQRLQEFCRRIVFIGGLSRWRLHVCAPQRPIKAFDQMVVTKRLSEEATRGGFRCSSTSLLRRKRAHQNYRLVISGFNQTVLEIGSRHPGHLQVGNDATGLSDATRRQILLRRRKRFRLMAKRSNETPNCLAHRPVVVNNANHCRPLRSLQPLRSFWNLGLKTLTKA